MFQYYRYGIRHPRVAERTSHNALVIDFGGGTFDVCVISTTREGDISQSGRKSRPLAASSIPVGGFYVNRLIAEQVYKKQFGKDKARYKRAAAVYHRWLKDGKDTTLDSVLPEVKRFVMNLHRTSHFSEDLKLTLCRNMPHWDLEKDVNLSAPLSIPADPFGEAGTTIDVRYTAAEFRALFETSVWRDKLRAVVGQALNGSFQADRA